MYTHYLSKHLKYSQTMCSHLSQTNAIESEYMWPDSSSKLTQAQLECMALSVSRMVWMSQCSYKSSLTTWLSDGIHLQLTWMEEISPSTISSNGMITILVTGRPWIHLTKVWSLTIHKWEMAQSSTLASLFNTESLLRTEWEWVQFRLLYLVSIQSQHQLEWMISP